MPTPLINRPLTEAVAIRESASMVRQSNDLIQKSHFNLGVTESKIWLYIVQQIKPTDTVLGEMQFKILDFCKIAGINPNSGASYRTVRQALKRIADSSIFIRDANGDETLVRWLSSLKLSNRSGIATIEISKEMQPYLLALHEHYTALPLIYAARLHSRYSVRLYELVKSYANLNAPLRIELDELKKMLELKNDSTWGQIHRNVIDKAVGDINDCTDIQLTYDTIKEGHNIIAIVLFMQSFPLEIRDKRMSAVEKDLGPAFAEHYVTPTAEIQYDEVVCVASNAENGGTEEAIYDTLQYSDGASKPKARTAILKRINVDKIINSNNTDEQSTFDLLLRTLSGLCNRHMADDVIIDGGNREIIDGLNKIISNKKFDDFMKILIKKYSHIFDDREPVQNPVAYINKSVANDILYAPILLKNSEAKQNPFSYHNIPVTRETQQNSWPLETHEHRLRLKRHD